MIKIILNDDVIFSLAKLVDDSQTKTREPSHSQIEFLIKRHKLNEGDPSYNGQIAGKTKRVRSVLNWAYENNPPEGKKFALGLIQLVKSVGGFRSSSPNYIGNEYIINLRGSLKNQNILLDEEGNLNTIILDNLSEIEKEEALINYAKRAKKGYEDAALLVGTSKDLLEAVAAHILIKLWGSYSERANFPMLLGQVFAALGLETTIVKSENDTPEEKAKKRVNTAYYELGCSINALRNKSGVGHGKPFISSITDEEAKAAIESMGIIAEYLLSKLKLYKE